MATILWIWINWCNLLHVLRFYRVIFCPFPSLELVWNFQTGSALCQNRNSEHTHYSDLRRNWSVGKIWPFFGVCWGEKFWLKNFVQDKNFNIFTMWFATISIPRKRIQSSVGDGNSKTFSIFCKQIAENVNKFYKTRFQCGPSHKFQ